MSPARSLLITNIASAVLITWIESKVQFYSYKYVCMFITEDDNLFAQSVW